MLTTFNNDPDLLTKVITGDKSLCMAMTLKPKANHLNGAVQKSQDRNKHTNFRSNLKVLLIVSFDCNRVVHHKFSPQGRRVNKEYYLEVIRRLREIRQKRTELWKNQSWILRHDKALGYISIMVREFLAKNKTVIMPQCYMLSLRIYISNNCTSLLRAFSMSSCETEFMVRSLGTLS